jgi:hypothetical protein
VDDSVLVGVREGVRGAAQHLEHDRDRERTLLLENRVERPAVHVLHRDEEDLADVPDAVHGNDVWMIERRRHARFALEPVRHRGAERELRRKHLQRDGAAEVHFLGLVDDRHAAATELRLDVVVLDQLPFDELKQLIGVLARRRLRFLELGQLLDPDRHRAGIGHRGAALHAEARSAGNGSAALEALHPSGPR